MTPLYSRKLIYLTMFTLLVTLIGGGTVLFHSLEDWTWIQSFYFTIVTITTVGYGDITPTSDSTRLVAAGYIVIGVAVGAGIISYYGKALVQHRVSHRAKRNAKAREKAQR